MLSSLCLTSVFIALANILCQQVSESPNTCVVPSLLKVLEPGLKFHSCCEGRPCLPRGLRTEKVWRWSHAYSGKCQAPPTTVFRSPLLPSFLLQGQRHSSELRDRGAPLIPGMGLGTAALALP